MVLYCLVVISKLVFAIPLIVRDEKDRLKGKFWYLFYTLIGILIVSIITYNLNISGNVSCGNNSIFAKSMSTTSLSIASQNGMAGYALTYHSLYWTRSTKDRDNHINSMIKKYLKDNNIL